MEHIMISKDEIKRSTCQARDQWYLWSPGTQVWSLTWHRGLRIRHCCSCSVGQNYSSDLIPGLGTPNAVGHPKKKKRKKEKERSTWTFSFLTEISEEANGIMLGKLKVIMFSILGKLQTFTMKYCLMREAHEWIKFRGHNHWPELVMKVPLKRKD